MLANARVRLMMVFICIAHGLAVIISYKEDHVSHFEGHFGLFLLYSTELLQ